MNNQKPNFWARLRSLFVAGEQLTATRKYKASLVNRLHKNWTTQSNSANWDIRQGLRTLRARSREECQNDPLFAKFLSLQRSNVIGTHGLQLQVEARKPRGAVDTDLNKMVEELFWEWANNPAACSISGKLDFVSLQNLVVTNMARDGEALIQFIQVKDRTRNKFGFSLKVIDVDYLDETYNDTTLDGNRIIMSVEVDNDNRPLAYWLTTPSSNIMFAPKRERQRTRVPAEQILHIFRVHDDEEQVRGIPWTHAALLKAKYLNSVQDAVLINVQLAANTTAVLTPATPDEGAVQFTGDDGEARPPIQYNSEPGSITVLDPGMTLTKFDPNQPHDNYAEHVKIVQADIATALEMTYFELTGDMEAVNFSSSRVGLSSSRDAYKAKQQLVGNSLCTPVFEAFKRAALLNDLLKVSPREYSEIARHSWRGRGWPYIQPKDDAMANALAMQTGQTTLIDVLAEQGEDLDDHIAKMVSVRDRLKAAGIEISYDTKAAAASDTTDTANDTTGAQDKAAKKKDKSAKV